VPWMHVDVLTSCFWRKCCKPALLKGTFLYSKYSNECLGYINREVLDQLNNYHPLKYDSVPLSYNQCPDCVFWIMSPRLPIHGHSIYTGVTQGCEKIWLYLVPH